MSLFFAHSSMLPGAEFHHLLAGCRDLGPHVLI